MGKKSTYDLSNEQKNLLRKIVKCDEEDRLFEKGLLILMPGDDKYMLWGCKMDLDSLSDLEALCDESLLKKEQDRPSPKYRITNAGRKAVKNNFKYLLSDSPSEISLGDVNNSQIQIQQNSPDSVQRGKFVFGEAEKVNVEKLIEQVEDYLAELQLTADNSEDVKSEISTIKAQLKSKRTNPIIIRESLQTLRSLVEGAVGSIIAAGIIENIDVILGQLPF